MSTLKVNNITDTSGGSTNLTVPNTAKAWVNFNGSGTVAIRANFNVSSITDNGTGDYTVNFTTAMVDVNYGVVTSSVSSQAIVKTADSWGAAGTNPTTTSVRVFNRTGGSNVEDPSHDHVAIFR
jgi:hypothetical protein